MVGSFVGVLDNDKAQVPHQPARPKRLTKIANTNNVLHVCLTRCLRPLCAKSLPPPALCLQTCCSAMRMLS